LAAHVLYNLSAMILNKYKNELLNAIGGAGLNPPDFQRNESSDSLKLTFKNGVWFEIYVSASNPDAFARQILTLS
jgi:hypothetical protein